MFIVSITYKSELTEVEKHFDAHMAYVEKYYQSGHFLASGKKVPRTGGVIILNAKDKDEATQIVREDPFYTKDVADFEVTEFLANRAVEGLTGLLKE